ncbi:MAG: hypothetical protein IMY76_08835 [Chloroflexi bacterium]|nr:hypothetical protein [Chloroflexota bacterium]
MRQFVHTLLLMLGFFLTSCTAAPTTPTPTDVQPVTATPTAWSTLTPTLTPTSTPTETPTPTLTPTASPTPLGGGNGVILLENCITQDNCHRSALSLEDLIIRDSNQPTINLEILNTDYQYRLVYSNPESGETKTILECTDEFFVCYQKVLLGTLTDASIYIAQQYQQILYDGNLITDIFRLDTASLEATLIDQFKGSIFSFIPFPDSFKGLLSINGSPRRGEMIIYDLETLERKTVIQGKGQFYRVGTTPDSGVFWYRTTDNCQTELVSKDGFKIAQIMNSDGIGDWIDFDTILLFSATNNPPVCTRSGIALANRNGLTGNWITISRSNWALTSPVGGKVFYTSDCNSNGCTKFMLANPENSESFLLMESSERIVDPPGTALSPDGTKLIISWGKLIWMMNADGTDPQVLLETEIMWRVLSWMDAEF